MITKLDVNVFEQNILFLPTQVLQNQTSIFIIFALQNYGKNKQNPPILCYLDPTEKNVNQESVKNIGNKIRLFLNIMWQVEFGGKVDSIQNPFSKRSLPLWCPKGEYCMI